MMNLKAIRSIVLPAMAILLLSFTTAHKFYVSVTNVVYSEKNDSFQITSRIFIDDLEELLKERYGIDSKLATTDEVEVSNAYIEKYFKAKFAIELNGEIAPYTFLGREYDNDVILCYLELTDVNFSELKSISIQNEILTDLFEEQQNIVHVKCNGQKKSFVLIKENNKGMLNL